MKNFLFVLIIFVIFLKVFPAPVHAIIPTSSITPTPPTSPTPSKVPFPTLDIPDVVPACIVSGSRDETIYPPNSACYAEVKRTQIKVSTYPKTCIKEPTVSYADTRTIKKGKYSHEACDPSVVGANANNDPCNIYITVTTDVSKAELGSYGPSYDTIASSASADFLARTYLFNSLFDRPYYDTPGTPREAWRTYWRLLPINEQFNLVAQFFYLVNLSDSLDQSTLKKINNTKWQYIDDNGSVKETTVKKLAVALPDCLKTIPVCPDFAKIYNGLNRNTKAAYDTLIPLSFNSLRGFIALSPPSFPGRPPVPKTVSRESMPYIETIFAGLLSKRFGLLGNLQPSWLFTQSLFGLTDINTGYDLSTGKDKYILGQYMPNQNKFGDADMNVTILDNADIAQCPDYPDVYHISAPRTFPKNPKNEDPYHVQEILIKGSSLDWKLDKKPADLECTAWDIHDNCISETYVCNSYPEHCSVIGGSHQECCGYIVTGSGVGKALTVFNNPKTTDLKQSVVGNTEVSLYNTLVPNAFLIPTPTDKKIDAPTSTHNLFSTEYTGDSSVKNPVNPIYRENNLAQDTVHVIQNCWLVPSDQQFSSKCGLNIIAGTCDGTRFGEIVDSSVTPPSSKAESYFSSYILPKLIPEVMTAYSVGEAVTGVPCEVLAGIHYEEGGNDPTRSLQDGRPLSGMTLVQSAILAGQELNGKAGGEISDLDTLIFALSRYNGGGNSNCQPSFACPAAASLDRCGMTVACATDPGACVCTSSSEIGSCRQICGSAAFPWPIPYNFCSPHPKEGYDDPYAVDWWKSPEHDNMYLLFAYDCTQTPPVLHARPGAFTAALSLYLSSTPSP